MRLKLQQIITHQLCLTINVVASNSELSREICDRLIDLEHLAAVCCGLFSDGCNCAKALAQFQLSCGLPRGVVNGRVAEALLEI